MTKVTLVTTKTCPFCPSAKRLWAELKKENNFDYEEVDAMSDKGQALVERFSIMSVPTTIIDNKVAFVGVPDRTRALNALKK